MSIRVRAAIPDDIDWLTQQVRDFAAFYGTKRSLFKDEATAREKLAWMIQDHVMFVADDGSTDKCSERMGFIAGLNYRQPYNSDIRVLSESFWWVPQEHRGSRAGAMLLQAFIDWGRDNVDWIAFSLEANSPVSPECLTKRGFVPRESSFLLEF